MLLAKGWIGLAAFIAAIEGTTADPAAFDALGELPEPPESQVLDGTRYLLYDWQRIPGGNANVTIVGRELHAFELSRMPVVDDLEDPLSLTPGVVILPGRGAWITDVPLSQVSVYVDGVRWR